METKLNLFQEMTALYGYARFHFTAKEADTALMVSTFVPVAKWLTDNVEHVVDMFGNPATSMAFELDEEGTAKFTSECAQYIR